MQTLESIVYGTSKNTSLHGPALGELKSVCMQLNNALKDKSWLAGGQSLTVADVIVFCALIPAFQLSLDSGYRKAVPALT